MSKSILEKKEKVLSQMDNGSEETNNEKKEATIVKNVVRHNVKNDNIKLYLEEINRYSLLSWDEEKELSEKIIKGNQDALNSLIKANLRLVVKIAKLYVSEEYPFIDLIQDGNLGLIKAAQKFDYRKNTRFSTYASWWIKQTIVRSLSVKKRMIRLPHRKEEKIRKLNKILFSFNQKYKRSPTLSELSVQLKLNEEDIKKLLLASNTVISIENKINEESNCLKNTIGDESFKPEDLLIKKNLKLDTELIFNTLYPKEKMIIKHRFGFDGEKKYTLKTMGEIFGISPETVRQIEIKALKKIRNKFSYLKDYMIN